MSTPPQARDKYQARWPYSQNQTNPSTHRYRHIIIGKYISELFDVIIIMDQ
ncbi:Uncharacterised protein [Moraxella equi]|uniref:Uncharacterized protein n=1 Tax=Moraxella equi TaxID=60442 RepID=A0A378QMX8_9GAMM|nr:Uncharacterised protein [Moraxella equi]